MARGPLLAGFLLRDCPEFDDWRARHASAVEREVAALLDHLATMAEARGATTGAIRAASRRVELDPLDEAAHRRLMRLLATSGDRAGAIRQYRNAVATLERELSVPPLPETTDLYEAIRDGTVGATPSPKEHPFPTSSTIARRQRPPIVGRDEPVARLVALWSAIETEGRVAAIEGEPGIGKTRLAEAVADHVRSAGGVALEARAWPAEASIAYAPIIELLRRGFAAAGEAALAGIQPEVLREVARLVPLPQRVESPETGSPASDGPAAHARLLEAISVALAGLVAGPTPAILVVEDLQWADEATREVVLYLARRLDRRPLLLLGTWREEDLDPLASAFIERMRGIRAFQLEHLERLPPDASSALIAALQPGLAAGDIRRIVEAAEGLPLYLVEAVTAADTAAAPRSVHAMMRERVSGVTDLARQVLDAAAVIGRSFTLSDVRMVSGRPEDEAVAALDELLRRGLVRELEANADVSFDFAHGALRDVVLEGISVVRRRLLHGRSADALRAGPAGRLEPSRLVIIAGHEEAAGRLAEAAETYREAGRRARDVYAHHEAIVAFEAALALGQPDVADLQLAIGESRTAQGDYVGAIAALESAAAVTTDQQTSLIELRLGEVHTRRGDLQQAASHLDDAISRAEAVADHRMIREASLARALVAVRAADLNLAEFLAGRALASAEHDDDADGVATALRATGLIAWERGDLGSARVALQRSVDVAAVGADPAAAVAAANALALVEAALGDLDGAIDRLVGALDAVRRTGDRHLEAAIENNLADQLHAAGRTSDSMAHLKRAVTLFADIGGRPDALEPEVWKLVSW
jgi:tetratricopeptide (TPR) repeat protein